MAERKMIFIRSRTHRGVLYFIKDSYLFNQEVSYARSKIYLRTIFSELDYGPRRDSESAIHLYTAPGYGYFSDELYTIALSRHLAFGYVDLPPLVPALVALSRALLGGSLLALHIVPALAGAATLVFICLITREFGGKSFAVALSALGFIIVPLWLNINSIFCYDSIDQLVLAAFLYALVRFLRSGNPKLWLLLGLLAGIACMTKMTILFLGPGFLVALLVSKYRKDLLTPWPWLGAALCLVIIFPYLVWELANHWPTLEYWNNYGGIRMYPHVHTAVLHEYSYLYDPFLMPLYVIGLYRIFRRLDGVNYGFLGLLFLITLVLMYVLLTPARMLAELFIPLLAAGAVFLEEVLARLRWEKRGESPCRSLPAGHRNYCPAAQPADPASKSNGILCQPL